MVIKNVIHGNIQGLNKGINWTVDYSNYQQNFLTYLYKHILILCILAFVQAEAMDT